MPRSSRGISSFPGDLHVAGGSHRRILAERRATVRYPLDLSVRFRSISGSLFSGAGRAVNVSSGGVLVASTHIVAQHEISVGLYLEMSIEWPLLLDGIPLQLFAAGWVVRRRPFDFAASFERYQFRTMRRSGKPPVRSRGEVIEWPRSEITQSD
ncbi:MAG: PilZ domain-containing protein [Bryobacteraceae bacterium]